MSLHDPIGTDKEGNESTLINTLGSEADDVIKEVDLKIEKSKIYRNLYILDEREGSRGRAVWFGYMRGRADATVDCEGSGDIEELCVADREKR